MKQVAKHLLTVLAFLGLILALPAQAQTTSGTVKGTILAPDGSTLTGATLTLSSPALMTPKVITSEEAGRFNFQDLPAGIYTLRVTYPGYNDYIRDKIQVDIGRAVILPIFLTRPESGNVMVIQETGNPTVDVQKTSTSEVLSTDFLEDLPQTRDYQSAIQALPGVTGGANPNVQGSATDENVILLDGVNITDPVTGTFGLNFNFDAMEQVEVMSGGYGAEYGQAMGGITNITTKSGGNDLEAKFSLTVRDAALSPSLPASYASDGTILLGSELDSTFRSVESAVTVGGPVIKDRLWYFASYSFSSSDITNLGVQVPRQYRGHYLFGKLTFQPNSKHQIATSYFTNPTTIDYIVQSALTPPEAEGTQAQGGGFVRMDWNWYIGAHTQLQTRAYSFSTYINVHPVPCSRDPFDPGKACEGSDPEGTVDYETIGAVGFQGAYAHDNYYRYVFDNRSRRTVSAELNHYIPQAFGEHELQAGSEFTVLGWDYLGGTIGNLRNNDILLNPLGNPNDPANVSNYYTVEYNGPLVFQSQGRQLSVYASDSWTVIPNVTLNLGVRFDNVAFINDAGEKVIATQKLAPRLGVAWDPFKDQTTRVYASFGSYVDTGRFAVSSFINERGQGFKLFLGDYFVGSEGSLYQFDAGQSRILTAPSFLSPHTEEITLGVEREVIYDIALGVQGVQKWFSNLWEDDEINLIWNDDATQVVGGRYSGEIADVYRLRTPATAYRTYQALQISARQRFYDKKLQLISSYSLSRNVGNTSTNLTANLDIPQQNPYFVGYLPTDRRHVFTGQATYALPLDFVLGAKGTFQSGTPFNQLYWSEWYLGYNNLREPQGVHARNPSTWLVDLRVQKKVDLREWGHLEASFDIFNLFNNRNVATVSTSNYATLGEIRPGSVLRPRSFQFGLRLEY